MSVIEKEMNAKQALNKKLNIDNINCLLRMILFAQMKNTLTIDFISDHNFYLDHLVFLC